MRMTLVALHNGDRCIYWGRILLVSLGTALVVAAAIILTALISGGTATVARLPSDATFWTLISTAFIGLAAGLARHARMAPVEE